ncbi:MAG: neocarzinostatin apoprotein domain-containing protein [Acidimicrobiales bacterium]
MSSVRVRRLSWAAVALTAGLVVSLGTWAGGATTPHLVVTPAAGLVNGSTVRVSGTGFKPHDSVFIVECLTTAKGAPGCAIGNATPVTITAKGVLPTTKFKVATGTIGSGKGKGKCGTKASNLKGCEVSAGNADGKDTAAAPIKFKIK